MMTMMATVAITATKLLFKLISSETFSLHDLKRFYANKILNVTA